MYAFAAQTEWIAYADEADLLNVALFGCTAKEWRKAKQTLNSPKTATFATMLL
jgi:hypothetical protein